jgi:purine-binding chemotaxis protein CheW
MQENETVETQVFTDEDSQEGKYLTFPIGDEEFGIEIRSVREIIGIQKITDVPEMPHFIKGVINLRGKIIPVMDIRLKFGMQEREYDERTTIIVVHISNIDVGLIVDNVSEVLDIANSDIEPPSKLTGENNNQYVKAFGKVSEKVIIILDTQKLLFGELLEQMIELDQ